MKKLMVMAVAALPLIGLQAASTIYLANNDLTSTEWIDASDMNNWTTEFDSGTKQAVPGHPPTLANMQNASYNPCFYRAVSLDLGGQTFRFNLIRNQGNSPYTGSAYWGDATHPWAFTNGTILIDYDMLTRHKPNKGVDIWNGATIDASKASQYFGPGSGQGGADVSPWTIHAGGALKTAVYKPYDATITVEAGGFFEVTKSFRPDEGSKQPYNRIINRGTTRFAKGVLFDSDVNDGNEAYKLVFTQEAGDLYVGGDISRGVATKAQFEFLFTGGTIHPTVLMAAIRADAGATVPAGSFVAVDVPPGGTFDLSGVTFADDTTLTVRGAGKVLFGASKPTTLLHADRVFYRGVPAEPIVGADGLQLVLEAPLLSLENLTLPDDYELIVDPLVFKAGDTVVKSSDAAFLESVLAKLSAEMPIQYPNADVTIVGDEIQLVAKSVTPVTYYWNKGARGDMLWGDATDLDNWSTAWDSTEMKPDDAAVPARLPTVDDEFCVTRDLLLDLKGRTMRVKAMSLTPNPYGGTYWGADTDSWGISNGTVYVDRDIITRHKGSANGDIFSCFDIWGGGRLIQTDGTKQNGFTAGDGKGGDQPGGISYFRIHRGGEAIVNMRYRFFSSRVIVDEGGRFESRRISFSNNTKYEINSIENHGTCLFPLGIDTVEGTTNDGKIALLQRGGVLQLGGDVHTNELGGRIELELSGGTIEALSNVAFRITSVTMPASADATLKVAPGMLLDMTGFDYGADATLTKAGAGAVRFDDYPSALSVAEGLLALTVPNGVLPDSVVFADGAGLRFAAVNTALPAIANADKLVCEVDLSVLKAGDTLATSADGATLAGICDGLNAVWAKDPKSRIRAVVEGTALKLVKTGPGLRLILR